MINSAIFFVDVPMPRTSVKKFTALLLLVSIVIASVLCLCPQTEAAGMLASAASTVSCDAATEPCQDCPGDSHSDTGSRDLLCDCPCQPTLIEPLTQLGHFPLVEDLVLPERFTAFPEIYLTKFVPPQNLA